MQVSYKVRSKGHGADRRVWMIELFEHRHGPRKLEFGNVKDFSMSENFRNAMKGVEGPIYVASHIDIYLTDPLVTIAKTFQTVMTALEAVAEKPSVEKSTFSCLRHRLNQD